MPRTGLAVFAEVLRGLFSEVRIAKQRLSSALNERVRLRRLKGVHTIEANTRP